jgi:hypothetical protein
MDVSKFSVDLMDVDLDGLDFANEMFINDAYMDEYLKGLRGVLRQHSPAAASPQRLRPALSHGHCSRGSEPPCRSKASICLCKVSLLWRGRGCIMAMHRGSFWCRGCCVLVVLRADALPCAPHRLNTHRRSMASFDTVLAHGFNLERRT